MAAGNLTLGIAITATAHVSSVLDSMSQMSNSFAAFSSHAMEGMGPVIGAVAGVDLAIAGMAVDMGVKAVKAAGDFQAATLTLVTGAGELQSNLEMVRQGILNISVATGTTTSDLTAAMFTIESAGYRGAAGLQVLSVAAQGATVAHANFAQMADVLTTSLHDYHLSAAAAVPVTNSLVVAVQNGKMTMDMLNQSLTNVLPVASALHVPLADVEGALSTMAISGDKGASAGTHLAMMLKMLANPASSASKEMAAMGINSVKLAQTMRTSLPGALQMIQDAVAKHFTPGSVEYNRAIATIMGGSKSGTAGLEIMGGNMKTLVSDTKSASDALHSGGSAVQGYAAVQQTMNFKLAQANAAWNVFLITLGQQLMPIVTQVAAAMVPVIQGLQQVAMWALHNWAVMTLLKVVFGAIAIVIGGVLLAGILMLVIGLGALALALAIPAAIVLGIIWVFQNWGMIAHWLQGVWAACIAWLMSAFSAMGSFFTGLWGGVTSWFMGVWSTTIAWIMGVLGAIGAWFTGLWHRIASGAQAGWNAIINGIKNIVTGIAHWLSSTWSNIVNTVVGWFKWLYNHNYYFKDLVDTIRHIVTAFVAWFENAWKTTVANVTAIWNGIKAVASTVWNAITSAIHTAVTTVHDVIMNIWNAVVTWIVSKWNWLKGMATTYFWAIYLEIQSKIQQAENFIHSVWSSIVSWLQGIWSTITGDVTTAWQNISNIFSSAWNTYVAPPLNSLKTSITNLFTDLANTAISWGKNIIQGFINGMTSMIGAVGNAAQNIISTVGGFLGFHSPAKEGPGKELDIWGPNLVKGFTTGIVDSLPMMRSAMQRLMQPLSVAMTASPAQSSGNAFALSGAQGGNSFALSGTTPIVVQVQPTAAEIHLDGRKVGQSVSKYQGKAVRIEGGFRSV